MHTRIHRAYWNHEAALRSYYLDVKWVFIVTALEALMNTGENKSRMQFVERVSQLAKYFGDNISEKELHDAYTLRSELAHAQKFLFQLVDVLPQEEHVPLYAKLESLLRKTLLTSLLDPTFGDRFRDVPSVDAQWPVTFPTTRPKKASRTGP